MLAPVGLYDAGNGILIENLGAPAARCTSTSPRASRRHNAAAAPARVWDGGGARDIARHDHVAERALLNWSRSRTSDGSARRLRLLHPKASARGCAGTIVGAWSPATQPPADFITGAIALRAGRRYFGCVRARDNAGNVSQPRCSDGQVR